MQSAVCKPRNEKCAVKRINLEKCNTTVEELLVSNHVPLCLYHILKHAQWLRLRLGVAISRMLDLRAACYWPPAWQQAGAVKRTTSTGGFVIVRSLVVNLLLFTCK